MTTSLQRARNAIILRALLVKALKGLAPLYSGIVTASEELQDGVEDGNQAALVPVSRFLEDLDKLVEALEAKADKEFPEADVDSSGALDMREAARKTVDALREISAWSEKLAGNVRKFDPELATQIEGIRDNSLGVAMNLQDMILPEHSEVDREEMLMEEYRLLAGLKRLRS